MFLSVFRQDHHRLESPGKAGARVENGFQQVTLCPNSTNPRQIPARPGHPNIPQRGKSRRLPLFR